MSERSRDNWFGVKMTITIHNMMLIEKLLTNCWRKTTECTFHLSVFFSPFYHVCAIVFFRVNSISYLAYPQDFTLKEWVRVCGGMSGSVISNTHLSGGGGEFSAQTQDYWLLCVRSRLHLHQEEDLYISDFTRTISLVPLEFSHYGFSCIHTDEMKIRRRSGWGSWGDGEGVRMRGEVWGWVIVYNRKSSEVGMH